jgi:hypothetical protein
VTLDALGTASDVAALACTAASLAVRAHALRTLEEHRARMRQSAVLIARSRALCAAAVAPERAAEPAPARPHLRLVEAGPAPARGAACMRAGCEQAAAFLPRMVISVGMRRVSIRGLPLRVCAVHARDLAALSRAPDFLADLRARMVRRGGEAPRAIDLEFDPLH